MIDARKAESTAKDATDKASQAAGKLIGDAQEQASAFADGVTEALEGGYERIKDSAQSAVDQGTAAVVGSIQERPGSSLLLAGFIGFALGVWLARQPGPRRQRYVWR